MFKKPLHFLNNLVKSTEAPSDKSASVLVNTSKYGRSISQLRVADVPLTLQVFNPGDTSIFPVASTLIVGPTEVALVDAQFHNTDAEDLVELIKSTGKKLTLVYISYGDPDYYFGCEVIRKAFPKCPFYAIKSTIDQIQSTKAEMLAFWSPTLAENAPKSVVVPQLLKNRSFAVDGFDVRIVEPIPKNSFCWVPSLEAVMGGFSVFGSNMHLWLANYRTTELRTDWYQTLVKINNLYPNIVVPSHFYPGISFDVQNVEFTEQYLSEVERQLPLTNNSAEFLNVIQKKYPQLEVKSNLEISAKVLKGEVKWPNQKLVAKHLL